MNKQKQIEEMAWEICDIPRHDSYKSCKDCNYYGKCHAMYYAERAYEVGYRKQSEGEWSKSDECTEQYGYLYKCSCCGVLCWIGNYCPNCGAKMSGGAK